MRLDEWCDPVRGVRVAVEAWHVLEALKHQYIEPPRTLRTVWNYSRRVGFVATLRKVHSRLAEGRRNTKVAAVGIGTVLESPKSGQLMIGQRVIFFAPNHPERPERVCLDEQFVRQRAWLKDGLHGQADRYEVPAALRPYVGWSSYGEVHVEEASVSQGLASLAPIFRLLLRDVESNKKLVAPPAIRDRILRQRASIQKPSAVLFGLGHYAKTQIIPHIRRALNLVCIHELDPDQLAAAHGWGVDLDTCPWPRDGESYDAWFIAGYHHMHTPLAIRALCSGAYAVVEKPLASTWRQYYDIRSTLEESTARRLFLCFHKRYSCMNEWAFRDLGVRRGEPIDMHCIVYEIPLPRLHWYTWPGSGSRLMSNGCHWLDYFLFVNDFNKVAEAKVWPLRDGNLTVAVQLQNAATLTMSLTEAGSARLGVRELIELRASDVTVRITDGERYEAESSKQVLRRRRVNPMDAYQRMYRTICRRITTGECGDSPESLISTEATLMLEDALRGQRNSAMDQVR